jgi:hypothetical protein
LLEKLKEQISRFDIKYKIKQTMRKLTTEEFIAKAKLIHGDKYDYSKSIYINSNTPLTVICPEHGEFYPTPNNHISNKSGCPMCNGGVKIDREEFIKRAISVHGNKYNYDNVIYIDSNTPVIITCPEHGDFYQRPAQHLSGNGCPVCAEIMRLTTEEFKCKVASIFGDLYNLDKVNYVNAYTPVIITCPIHGDFEKVPHNMISSHSGCPMCNGGVKIDREEFIKRAISVHGNKYNYDNVIYTNSSTPVLIICPEHGEFYQTPSVHLSGHGCPKCNSSKLETQVRLYLLSKNIPFIEQMKWEWLTYKQPQSVDFYLPELNAAIECQGYQHFIPSDLFDRTETLETRIERDISKQKLCLENGIVVYYYSNLSTNNIKFIYPYQVYENLDLLVFNIFNNNYII